MAKEPDVAGDGEGKAGEEDDGVGEGETKNDETLRPEEEKR
jgi:hypothetical protein